MGVLLVVACVALAFLCGRLQVRVTRYAREAEELRARQDAVEAQLELYGGRLDGVEGGMGELKTTCAILGAGVKGIGD